MGALAALIVPPQGFTDRGGHAQASGNCKVVDLQFGVYAITQEEGTQGHWTVALPTHDHD
jgi:hypothetical protein